MDTSDLAKRMKRYEAVSKGILMKREPVIIRLDGKAFHTVTRDFRKPFDPVFVKAMQDTMKYLCENIQGCVLGYCQSDEISLVLIDYLKHETAAWFDYEIQKMCSITAGMASMAFNKCLDFEGQIWENESFSLVEGHPYPEELLRFRREDIEYEKWAKFAGEYEIAVERGAILDSRVFNLPKEEVTNYFYWRQLDASRNSIQMLGQANFSHNELQNKSCSNIQDMLMQQKGINWNDLPTTYKRGSCCVKNMSAPFPDGMSDGWPWDTDREKSNWTIDDEIPLFKGDGRKYIDDLIYVGTMKD